MGVLGEFSARDEVAVQHAARGLHFKAALPAIAVVLWAAILGAAAYLLMGVRG
jgi:hypothetical protein